MENRVIIAGSREFADYEKAEKEIDKALCTLCGKICIVSGHCRGADMLGERYAKEHGLDVAVFPAKWGMYGKRAGYIRNNEMAAFAAAEGNDGILLAFWDGVSRGTKMMIDIAKEKGLKIIISMYKGTR